MSALQPARPGKTAAQVPYRGQWVQVGVLSECVRGGGLRCHAPVRSGRAANGKVHEWNAERIDTLLPAMATAVPSERPHGGQRARPPASRSRRVPWPGVTGVSIRQPLPLDACREACTHARQAKEEFAMRVLHVVSGDLWAGAEVQVRNLVAAQCVRDGVLPHVAVFNEGRLASELRALGIPVWMIEERVHSSAAIMTRLSWLVREWRIDVVHTHRQKENVLGALAAASRRKTISIRTIHGAPEPITGVRGLKRRLVNTVDRLVGRSIQAGAVAVSEDLANQTRKWLPPERIRLIANGIELSAPEQPVAPRDVSLGCAGRPTTVGFFGRLVAIKRVDILLQAAEIVERQRPGEFRFEVFGDGPERPRLDAQAQCAGLSQTVVFRGFVDRPVDAMSWCDTIVITSDHEGLPTVLLEAMQAGRPVIARRVGGIPAVLENGRHGTLIDTGDPAEFARHLLQYRDWPDRYVAAANSAQLAVREYSSERMAERYGMVYRELARSGATRLERVTR